MKRLTLSLAILFLGISVVLAQVIQTSKGTPSLHKGISKITVEASTKALAEELAHAAKCTTLFHKPSLENSKTVKGAPRKSRANGVLMGRPEGSFYNRGNLKSGGSFTSILLPRLHHFKFFNYCNDHYSAIWLLESEVLEGDAANNLIYYIPDGTDSLIYAPSIQVGNNRDQLVDFMQPIDSKPYTFSYLNTVKTGYYYFSSGSPFKTEDINYDMNGDGVVENYKIAGIRQYIIERPIQTLILHDIKVPFYSSLEKPLKGNQTLKCIIRKINSVDEEFCELGETIAEMEVTAEDLEEGGSFVDGLYSFNAVFANYEKDESGTLRTVPITINERFAIDIVGFDNKGTDIQLYGAFLHQDDNEFYTKRTRATRIVLNNLDGTEYTGGTLSIYGPDAAEPYGYCAIIFMEGEMNGIDNFNNEKDGIFYNLYLTDKTAEVIGISNNYSGSIDIPETVVFDGVEYVVTAIHQYTFSGCSGLTNFTIPGSVTSIDQYAFSNCSGLTSIILPNSINYIGEYAFSGCSSLTNVTIPNSVTRICSGSFQNCSSLMSLTIPTSVTSINQYAFSGCSSLTSIILPNSVTSIGSGAFENCSSLESVKVPVTDNTTFCKNKIVGLIYSNIGKPVVLIDEDGNEIKDFIIPDEVIGIGNQAFCNCSGLSTITIGSGVTSIGDNAFANIPNLTDVFCYAENVPTISSNAFEGSYIEGVTLHVPANSVELYKKAGLWKTFKEIVAIVEPPSEKCATPTIVFANGQLSFECETEGVEFVTNISLANMENNSKVDLFSVYRFSVYAKKEGYADSDVASVNIDLNRLKGDMNNDGIISISDAVALVDIILGGLSGSTRYYSVGTDAVTADNYTTANNAHQVNSLNAIPDVLLTVSTPGVYYILLPDKFEPEVGGVVFFNVTKLNVNIPGYSVYRTTSLSAGVQIKKVNVGASGSQIDYE